MAVEAGAEGGKLAGGRSPIPVSGWGGSGAGSGGEIGLLVPALTLLPSGQLDGGHIAYALFGVRYEKVARAVPYLLLPLGLLWAGWILWSLMLLFLGTRHPPPLFDEVPLTPGRRGLGFAAALLFLICFTPNPIPG